MWDTINPEGFLLALLGSRPMVCTGREHRTFRPHVTVARRRAGGGDSGSLRISVMQSPGPTGEPFLVESFVLMRSELKPAGSTYTPVARFPIASK